MIMSKKINLILTILICIGLILFGVSPMTPYTPYVLLLLLVVLATFNFKFGKNKLVRSLFYIILVISVLYMVIPFKIVKLDDSEGAGLFFVGDERVKVLPIVNADLEYLDERPLKVYPVGDVITRIAPRYVVLVKK